MDEHARAHAHDSWVDHPGYPLERDFPRDEYELRLARARALMAAAGLDALVVTSGAIGGWFTSQREPHEWHDRCQSRSAWFILTADGDHLYMTPTAVGEHFATTRRATWVTHIHGIVERVEPPRQEIWSIEQIPRIFADLGLTGGRLGFELGDCMTLGINVADFLRLRELLPTTQLVDGSAVFRRLMSVHTPLEIERTRLACQAGVWVHDQVPLHLRPGMRERDLLARLAEAFRAHFGDGYLYQPEGGWDVRNATIGDWNTYHAVATDRVYQAGDLICRGNSGASYRGYPGDVDRVWHLGPAAPEVERFYRIAWEANQAMAEVIRPGARCSEMYAAGARVERAHGLPERPAGRVGHGLRNTGGLSVHPDVHTVLEPGMIISVETMLGAAHGFYDCEDQYLVTETGREILNPRAPERLPIVAL